MVGPEDISLRSARPLIRGGTDGVGDAPPAPSAPSEAAHDYEAAIAARPLIAASGAIAGLAQMLRVEAAAAPLVRSAGGGAAGALADKLEAIEGAGPKWLSFTDAAGDVRRLAKRLGADGRISAGDVENLVRAAKDFKSISTGERAILLDVLHGKHGKLDQTTGVALARFLGVTAPIKKTGDYKLTSLLGKHRAFQQVKNGDRVLGTGDYGASIADFQRVLSRLGYRMNADGRFGPGTKRMLQRFQADHGLSTSGKLDAETLRSLSQAADGVQPAQPVKPVQTTTGGDKIEIALDVPFFSQFDKKNVERAGKTACFRALKTMIRAYQKRSGVKGTLQGPFQRIDVGTKEDRNGDVITTRKRADAARASIDRSLAKGLPVIVGASESAGNNYNHNPVTDHYVLITGRGVDAKGRTYYTFNDPATSNAAKGRGRFYVDADGKLEKAGTRSKRSYVIDRHYEVSEVRTWAGVN